MPRSFHEAFSPILIVTCLMGMGIFEYPLGRPRMLLSFAYIAILSSIYGYLYTSGSFVFIMGTWSRVSIFTYHIGACVILIMLVSILHHNKEYHWCLDKLAAVDNTLHKLGNREDYRKICRSTMKITSVWCIHAVLLNSTQLIWSCNNAFTYVVLISSVINHPYHALTAVILKFGILVSYIGSRFDRVNEHIRSLIKDGDCEVTCAARAPFVIYSRQSSLEVRKCKEAIEILMHVHAEICRIVQKIDAISGVELSLFMGLNFFIITTTFCIVYEIITCMDFGGLFAAKVTVTILNNSLLHVSRLCYVHYVSEGLRVKAAETQRHLHKLANCIYDAEVRADITQFIMQIIHSPPKLTAMGLFEVGYKFLHKFWASVATALVVVLQMYDTVKWGIPIFHANETQKH